MATDNSQLALYTGAEEYDLENGLVDDSLPFYSAIARASDGPALDLACGTGFLTIPLAQLGLDMTGVDRAPEMLDLARRKSEALKIHWVLGDILTLDLRARFRLITLTGNAFQEFLTRADQERLLDTVRRHLAPDGVFAFETRFPRASELLTPAALTGDWSEETIWRRHLDARGETVTVSTAQRHDALRQTVEYVIFRRWDEGGRAEVREETSTLRLVYPQEMDALLHYNGVAIRDAYGDWDRRPLASESPRMIYVCQLRR